MNEIFIRYTPGAEDNSVQVDGFELKGMTRAVRVTIQAGKIPTAELDIEGLRGIEIDVVGEVKIDRLPIPESLARAIYQALRARFEPAPAPGAELDQALGVVRDPDPDA
jgi:hypothetical protein